MARSVRKSIESAMDGKSSLVQEWTGKIAAYEKEFKPWESRVDRILKRYRDDDRDKQSSAAKFNVLWSNVQTLVPAVYSRLPKPDVSRRFRDNDPVGRVAGLLIERALDYETQHYPDFRTSMKMAVQDRFLGGRGVVWARYEPHILAKAQNLPTDGSQTTEDVDEPHEELDYECAPVDYVHWKDFGHTVARSWEEVSAVWRRVYMDRRACVERFGEEIGEKLPLDSVPQELKKGELAGGDAAKISRACVYEIWDKSTMKAIWMSKSWPDVLDEKDDPLQLEGFFPCPKPLYATMTNESLVPVPDFALYQDQARELDTLADRIQGLINMLQVKGVHDASVESLARIFTEGDNGSLIPVKNWQQFAEKNGLAGAIDIVDLQPIYEALRAAYEAMSQVLQQIYDLTGISDIVRGQSDASTSATAERIKGQYASLRLKALQTDVAVFASQIMQLKAQIICGNFAPQTILQIAGAEELNPSDKDKVLPALQLLIGPERMQNPAEGGRGSNPLRSFRIEVASDTMVEIDEQEEKSQRVEFLTAMGTFMEKALPMATAAPQIRPLIMQLWKFSVGAFKVGKTIEGAFDEAIQKIEEAAKQPPPPKPDPEMEKVKAQQMADHARIQADTQAAEQKAQIDMQLEHQRMELEQRMEQQRVLFEQRLAAESAARDAEFQRWKATLEANTKVATAQIAADATVKSADERGEDG